VDKKGNGREVTFLFAGVTDPLRERKQEKKRNEKKIKKKKKKKKRQKKKG